MTREEMIALAKASLKKDVIYHRDGIELEWDDLIDFYHAAQRQAYERAAKCCDARYMGDNNREDMEAKRCAEAIRSMKV